MSDLIKELGGPAEVARVLGIKTPSVIGWRGRIPAERRPDLERAKYPAFTVEMAGDDACWVRVPDPDWPHPEGRPCLDVTRSERRAKPRVAAGSDATSVIDERRGTKADRRKHEAPIAFGDRRGTKPDRRDGAVGANHAA